LHTQEFLESQQKASEHSGGNGKPKVDKGLPGNNLLMWVPHI